MPLSVVATVLVLMKLKERLQTPYWNNRIGALYEDIDVTRTSALMYVPLFMARRVCVSYIYVFLENYTYLQIMLMLF